MPGGYYPTDFDGRFVALMARWLADHPAGWSGTPSELYVALAGWDDVKPWEYVPGRNALAREFARLKPALAAAGVTVTVGRTATARRITLEHRP